jgi:hypothetical protein
VTIASWSITLDLSFSQDCIAFLMSHAPVDPSSFQSGWGVVGTIDVVSHFSFFVRNNCFHLKITLICKGQSIIGQEFLRSQSKRSRCSERKDKEYFEDLIRAPAPDEGLYQGTDSLGDFHD